jgi:hypothetical protein
LPAHLPPRTPERARRAVLLGLAAALAALPAGAAEFRVDGSYRARLADNTDLALDERPARLGQGLWLENRLRLTGKVTERSETTAFELQMSFDIFDGLLAGDTARDFQGLGWDGRSLKLSPEHKGFAFRALFAAFRLPIGQFAVGQMPSHWGMGLVANSGNEEDAPDFGDARFGDTTERISFATRPLIALFGPRGIASEIVVAVAG